MEPEQPEPEQVVDPKKNMRKQWEEFKKTHPNMLVLFRMGDFYEVFGDDALKAAKLLDLAVTTREKGKDALPMAGFPRHSLEMHLRKLLKAGVRVAIADYVK